MATPGDGGDDGALQVTARGDREIVMTRTFHAPRSRVFDAYTRPSLLKRWFGLREGWSWVACDLDLKVGGAYRYLWRRADGSGLAVRGVNLDIVSPERLVTTESFDFPWYPGEAVQTLELVEKDGRTRLTATMRYESRAARDAVLASPMPYGVARSYARLAELLAA